MISPKEVILKSVLLTIGLINGNFSRNIICQYYSSGQTLNLANLIGSWVTVYTQPKAAKCFTLNIKSIPDSEQHKLLLNYGNFNGLVDWNACYLEVESTFGRHFFQGNGSEGGVLTNVIIYKSDNGQHILQELSADQWTIYGEENNELAVMRDCAGKATAVFARIPYWPTPHQLYAILYRSGVTPQTLDRIPCDSNAINR